MSRGTRRSPSPQTAKSTTRKFGCPDSFGTSKFSGIAFSACRTNSGVRVRSTISRAARVTSSVNSRVKKIGVSEIRKSAGHFSVSFTQRKSAAYLSGMKSALNRERSCGSTLVRWLRVLHQELSALHHLLAIKPNIEVPANTVDVG